MKMKLSKTETETNGTNQEKSIASEVGYAVRIQWNILVSECKWFYNT